MPTSMGRSSFVIPSAAAGLAEMHGRWGACRSPKSCVKPGAGQTWLPQDWHTTLKVVSFRRQC